MCNSSFFEKKQKILDFMVNLFILVALPFSPWIVLATWLNLRVPQKLQEK
jgi:hypothetical protein